MKRGHFLKAIGGLSLTPFLPTLKAQTPAAVSNCVLVPSETAGPFPLDLTENEFFFRQDIREGLPGVQLRQKVRIIGAENCLPMAGVRVNIWHCDRDGNYSGYGTETGLTYFRGYQFTDENGECEFITIVPGWYPGRVTHVHFQVYVSTQYSAISQWTWPHEAVVQAALDNPELYPEGPDPLSPGQDGVFADGFDLQMASLDWDASNGEYVSEYEATVQGAGTVGIGYEEFQTAQTMELGAAYPNPVTDQCTIPFQLLEPAEMSWSLWTVTGQRVASNQVGSFGEGKTTLSVDLHALGCAKGAYLLQIEAETAHGRFVRIIQLSKR
ncbi:MAG: T9SS type A sorting domain-containing protein [Flavobacteriales bacterium]